VIVKSRNRIFLEVERFDRVGRRGRISVATLDVIDSEYFGRLDTWVDASFRFASAGFLPEVDTEKLRTLSAFSTLIGNTDQHFGNVTLFIREEGTFALAPVYDVLPMALRPDLESIPDTSFVPPLPRADARASWAPAFEMAARFWKSVAKESAISPSFRKMAQKTLDRLEELREQLPPS
jgi:hypothetical protein